MSPAQPAASAFSNHFGIMKRTLLTIGIFAVTTLLAKYASLIAAGN